MKKTYDLTKAEAIARANNLANLGIYAPHKAKYYNRYNMDWLINSLKHGNKRFICFWHEGEEYPNHYFSQWYAQNPFSVNGRTYNTAEQYMMSEKALLFHDIYSYIRIMEEPSPVKCKQLGKQVSGFDQKIWDNALREILFHGNLAKMQSDIEVLDALLSTGDAVLVEASPHDGIYGSGLCESDMLNTDGSLKVMPENWKDPHTGMAATNHLGFVWMGIRDLFREIMHMDKYME